MDPGRSDVPRPAGKRPIHAWSFDHATLARKKETLGGEEARFLSPHGRTGEDWFRDRHFLSLTCDLPAAGTYANLHSSRQRPRSGESAAFQGRKPRGAGGGSLRRQNPLAANALLLGKLDLPEGPNHLMFKLVGKKPGFHRAGAGPDRNYLHAPAGPTLSLDPMGRLSAFRTEGLKFIPRSVCCAVQ